MARLVTLKRRFTETEWNVLKSLRLIVDLSLEEMGKIAGKGQSALFKVLEKIHDQAWTAEYAILTPLVVDLETGLIMKGDRIVDDIPLQSSLSEVLIVELTTKVSNKDSFVKVEENG